jgi:hypothetical protein
VWFEARLFAVGLLYRGAKPNCTLAPYSIGPSCTYAHLAQGIVASYNPADGKASGSPLRNLFQTQTEDLHAWNERDSLLCSTRRTDGCRSSGTPSGTARGCHILERLAELLFGFSPFARHAAHAHANRGSVRLGKRKCPSLAFTKLCCNHPE